MDTKVFSKMFLKELAKRRAIQAKPDDVPRSSSFLSSKKLSDQHLPKQTSVQMLNEKQEGLYECRSNFNFYVYIFSFLCEAVVHVHTGSSVKLRKENSGNSCSSPSWDGGMG